jgi:hypothetical protein
MASKKKLSIGITINLEHYENLRFEVESEVETPEDAGALVDYLDEVLSGFGRDDPAVMTQVDSYRQRVLGRGPGAVLVADAEAPGPAQAALVVEEIEEVLVAEQPVIEEIRNGDLDEAMYHTPADATCIGENADHSGERVAPEGEEACAATEEVCEAAAAPPVHVEETPAPAPEPQTTEGFHCEECGEAISKSQEQLSQLFMGRSLCKKCMDTQQG